MGEIREGQKVKLSFKTVNDEIKEVDCLIKGIYKDRLSLTTPEDIAGYAEHFMEGGELSAMIFTPLGIKVFDTIVLDNPFESDFVIEYTENAVEIQRREQVRVEYEAKVVIEREYNNNIAAKTIDISGKSLSFYYEGAFYADEPVSMSLFLPKQDRLIPAKGIIIVKRYIQINKHILLYTDIDERNRDKIIKTCYDLQLDSHNIFGKSE